MRWVWVVLCVGAAVAAVGCHGKPHVAGSWVGDLKESASLRVIVDQHKGGGRMRTIHNDDTTPGATVSVGPLAKGQRRVVLPACVVQARPTKDGDGFAVARGQHCHVELGSFERVMAVTGTGTVDGDKLTLELTGTASGVGGSYAWHFEGHRLSFKKP